MTDLRKAAEMALEALEQTPTANKLFDPESYEKQKDAIDTLRQALAQPEQEPVGYVTIENISSWAQVPSIKWFKKPTEGQLYTAPPKREWVGLTDEEMEDLWDRYAHMEMMRAIEAKLKEKNGG